MGFKQFLEKLETDIDTDASNRDLFLLNKDLLPVEPERRTWGWMNFVAFWIADSFNINTWQIAATSVVAGLSWWQAWIGVWIGYSCTGVFVVITSRIGAAYHISFPIICRAAFGPYGSLIMVLIRAFTACCWYGVQAWLGGTTVAICLLAIFPHADTNIPNHMASSGTTSFDYLSFFLFWLFSLPAIWFPVHKIRHLFTFKGILVPFAGFGFLIWTVKRAGGAGPVMHQPNKVHGSQFGWAFVGCIMNSLANFSTLIVNAPDFTRFATKRSSALWSQLLTIPLGFAITSFIGVVVSSASTVLTGETLWSPLDVLRYFLNNGDASHGTRAGVFFIAFVFGLAQLGTNISANSISAGTDLSALLPRYLNIRRGGYICAAIGLAMCPWNLFKSSSTFTTYLGAFSVFFSALVGVMWTDFYIIRKGYLEFKDLYSLDPRGTYYYNHGFSWKAYVAWVCGVVLNMPGFAGVAGRNVPIGATYVYNINFFGGLIVSSSVFYILSRIFPPLGHKINEPWAMPSEEEIDYIEGFSATSIHGVHPDIESGSVDYSSPEKRDYTSSIKETSSV